MNIWAFFLLFAASVRSWPLGPPAVPGVFNCYLSSYLKNPIDRLERVLFAGKSNSFLLRDSTKSDSNRLTYRPKGEEKQPY